MKLTPFGCGRFCRCESGLTDGGGPMRRNHRLCDRLRCGRRGNGCFYRLCCSWRDDCRLRRIQRWLVLRKRPWSFHDGFRHQFNGVCGFLQSRHGPLPTVAKVNRRANTLDFDVISVQGQNLVPIQKCKIRFHYGTVCPMPLCASLGKK